MSDASVPLKDAAWLLWQLAQENNVQRAASARLIADLLDAAREALHRLDCHMGDTDPSNENDPDLLACQALSAVITEAEAHINPSMAAAE